MDWKIEQAETIIIIVCFARLRLLSICQNWPASSIISQMECINLNNSLDATLQNLKNQSFKKVHAIYRPTSLAGQFWPVESTLRVDEEKSASPQTSVTCYIATEITSRRGSYDTMWYCWWSQTWKLWPCINHHFSSYPGGMSYIEQLCAVYSCVLSDLALDCK